MPGMGSAVVRRPAGLARPAALLALLLVAGLPGARPANAEAGGELDEQAIVRLAYEYRKDFIGRMPRPARADGEKDLANNPPAFGPDGLLKVDGSLTFRWDREQRRLVCAERVHRFRGPQLHGLTDAQILAAVRDYAQRNGTDTGGGVLDLNTAGPGIFLRRDYDAYPDADAFNAAMNRLNAAAIQWTRSHYLQALKAFARGLHPPDSATAQIDGFRVTLMLTADPQRTVKLWSRPPGAFMPWLVTASEAAAGGRLDAFLVFSGAHPGAGGKARIDAQFSFFTPDGKAIGRPLPIVMWDAPPPPAKHPQITPRSMTLTIDPGQAPGLYRLATRVCLQGAGCVELMHPVRILQRQSG